MSDEKKEILSIEEERSARLVKRYESIKDNLTELETKILRMRLGLYDGRIYSTKEVAEILDMSPEQVRVIHRKAFQIGRRFRRAIQIKDFYY